MHSGAFRGGRSQASGRARLVTARCRQEHSAERAAAVRGGQQGSRAAVEREEGSGQSVDRVQRVLCRSVTGGRGTCDLLAGWHGALPRPSNKESLKLQPSV